MNTQGMSAAVLALVVSSAASPAAGQEPEAPIDLEPGREVSARLTTKSELRWVPGEIIVKYREDTRGSAEDRLEAMGLTRHVRETGAGVAGVNWSSRVLPLRALGRCGGSVVDINDAIRWAAGLSMPGAPANPTPAKVINMSLGAPAPCSQSPATQAAIDDVVAVGVTVVAAAGNEAMDAANAFPASCNGVITVAASDYEGALVTRYSNFGDIVDVLAPGGDLAADEDGDGKRRRTPRCVSCASPRAARS